MYQQKRMLKLRFTSAHIFSQLTFHSHPHVVSMLNPIHYDMTHSMQQNAKGVQNYTGVSFSQYGNEIYSRPSNAFAHVLVAIPPYRQLFSSKRKLLSFVLLRICIECVMSKSLKANKL